MEWDQITVSKPNLNISMGIELVSTLSGVTHIILCLNFPTWQNHFDIFGRIQAEYYY